MALLHTQAIAADITVVSQTAGAWLIERLSSTSLADYMLRPQIPIREARKVASVPTDRFALGIDGLRLHVPRDRTAEVVMVLKQSKAKEGAVRSTAATVARSTASGSLPSIEVPAATLTKRQAERHASTGGGSSSPKTASEPAASRVPSAFSLVVNDMTALSDAIDPAAAIAVRSAESHLLDLSLSVAKTETAPGVTFSWWQVAVPENHDFGAKSPLNALWHGLFGPRHSLEQLRRIAVQDDLSRPVDIVFDNLARSLNEAIASREDRDQPAPSWSTLMTEVATELTALTDKALLQRSHASSNEALSTSNSWDHVTEEAMLLAIDLDSSGPAISWSEGDTFYILSSRHEARAIRLYAFDSNGRCRGFGQVAFRKSEVSPADAWSTATELLGVREP